MKEKELNDFLLGYITTDGRAHKEHYLYYDKSVLKELVQFVKFQPGVDSDDFTHIRYANHTFEVVDRPGSTSPSAKPKETS